MKSEPQDTPGWTVVGGHLQDDPVPGLPATFWSMPWHSTNRSIRVTDPIHGNQRTLWIRELDTGDEVLAFAADEISNGVFLVALPDLS